MRCADDENVMLRGVTTAFMFINYFSLKTYVYLG